jgi:hypothetical protein
MHGFEKPWTPSRRIIRDLELRDDIQMHVKGLNSVPEPYRRLSTAKSTPGGASR